MDRKERFLKYRELEKELEQKLQTRRENEVLLTGEFFHEEKFSTLGYFRLKQQCEYIAADEEIEIVLAEDCAAVEENFKSTFTILGANELSQTKKDLLSARMSSLILMLGGIVWFLMSYLAQTLEWVMIVKELFVIATWVFVWAAIEKFFFGRKELHEKRFKLLQMLSAKITVKGK